MPTVSWKGHIRLSLVSIPVRAYSAIDADADEIHFNQLHRECHSRIKYVKTCPLHGEVRPEDIVLGFEYEKNSYVIVEKEELESLQSREEKIVNIETIVPVETVDPIYFTERTSYLTPDGQAGQKPYAVIQKALLDQGVVAIGRAVRNGKDSMVMIGARQNLLTMTVLSTAAQVRDTAWFSGEVPEATVSAAELKLTKSLFDAYAEKQLDLSLYPEHYAGRVKELIEAKLAGQESVRPESSEVPQVINLMDALKKSVESARASLKKLPAKGKADKSVRPARRQSKTG